MSIRQCFFGSRLRKGPFFPLLTMPPKWSFSLMVPSVNVEESLFQCLSCSYKSVQYVIVPDEVTVFFKLTESWNDSYRACNLKHHVINWVFYQDIWHWRNKKAIINHKKFKIKIYFEVLCYCGKLLLRKIRAHYHISTFTQIAQIIFGNLICYSCSLMVQSTDAKNTFTL